MKLAAEKAVSFVAQGGPNTPAPWPSDFPLRELIISHCVWNSAPGEGEEEGRERRTIADSVHHSFRIPQRILERKKVRQAVERG